MDITTGRIGVTPVASVVRDVLHKSRHRQKYPGFTVEKVHFFWTTREQVRDDRLYFPPLL